MKVLTICIALLIVSLASLLIRVGFNFVFADISALDKEDRVFRIFMKYWTVIMMLLLILEVVISVAGMFGLIQKK